jgi:hypothetical protein
MGGKIDITIGEEPADSSPKKENNANQKASPSKKEQKYDTLPSSFITINAPAYLPDIPSVSMMVLIEPKCHKKNPIYLTVHLSAPTLNYLHTAAVAQMKSKEVHNKHPRNVKPSLGVKGLSRIHRGRDKGKYRFRLPGEKHIKVFYAEDDNAAKKRATESINDVQEEEAESDPGE